LSKIALKNSRKGRIINRSCPYLNVRKTTTRQAIVFFMIIISMMFLIIKEIFLKIIALRMGIVFIISFKRNTGKKSEFFRLSIVGQDKCSSPAHKIDNLLYTIILHPVYISDDKYPCGSG